jgi:glycosyltransferase involved in cell wall biosynthesis
MRALRFSRHLPSFGWDCDVLAQEGGSFDYFDPDSSLMSQVLPSAQVWRVPDPAQKIIKHLSQWFPSVKWGVWLDRAVKLIPVPDDKLLWGIRAAWFARQHREMVGNCDLVLATGYPWTSLLLGAALKRWFKVPLVCDLRDPWSELPGKRVGKRIHRLMERIALRHADAICVVSQGMRDLYANLYPEWADRIFVIYSGIDYSQVQRVYPLSWSAEIQARAHRKLRIVYTGSLLDKDNPSPYQRTLVPFLRILADALAQMPSLADQLDIRIVSNPIPKTIKWAERLGLAGLITFSTGRITFEEAQQAQRAADVLLLISTGDPAYDKVVMTGKIYEYLAAARPMLVISTPDCEAARVVENYHLGKTIYENGTEAVRSLLGLLWPSESFWAQFVQGVDSSQTTFDVRNQLQQLIQIMKQVTSKRNPEAAI